MKHYLLLFGIENSYNPSKGLGKYKSGKPNGTFKGVPNAFVTKMDSRKMPKNVLKHV